MLSVSNPSQKTRCSFVLSWLVSNGKKRFCSKADIGWCKLSQVDYWSQMVRVFAIANFPIMMPVCKVLRAVWWGQCVRELCDSKLSKNKALRNFTENLTRNLETSHAWPSSDKRNLQTWRWWSKDTGNSKEKGEIVRQTMPSLSGGPTSNSESPEGLLSATSIFGEKGHGNYQKLTKTTQQRISTCVAVRRGNYRNWLEVSTLEKLTQTFHQLSHLSLVNFFHRLLL